MKQQILYSLCLALSLCYQASAEQLTYFNDSEDETPSATIQRLSASRAWLGKHINTTGKKLDLYFMEHFFGDELINGDLVHNSKGKFFLRSGLRERKGLEGGIGLDVRLKLPNTEEHIDLVISSNDKSDDRVSETANNASLHEEDAVSTALQYLPTVLTQWRPRLQLGARWSTKPELFVEGRLKRRFGPENHNIRTSLSATHFTRRKTILTAQINYFKLLNENWGFRFANRVRYFNRGGYFTFDHIPALQHRIDDSNAMVYQVAASGDDQQHPYVDSYTASIRWRHRLYHSWLFLEIEPSHTYFVAPEINNDPESEAALFLRLEVLINND